MRIHSEEFAALSEVLRVNVEDALEREAKGEARTILLPASFAQELLANSNACIELRPVLDGALNQRYDALEKLKRSETLSQNRGDALIKWEGLCGDAEREVKQLKEKVQYYRDSADMLKDKLESFACARCIPAEERDAVKEQLQAALHEIERLKEAAPPAQVDMSKVTKREAEELRDMVESWSAKAVRTKRIAELETALAAAQVDRDAVLEEAAKRAEKDMEASERAVAADMRCDWGISEKTAIRIAASIRALLSAQTASGKGGNR